MLKLRGGGDAGAAALEAGGQSSLGWWQHGAAVCKRARERNSNKIK